MFAGEGDSVAHERATEPLLAQTPVALGAGSELVGAGLRGGPGTSAAVWYQGETLSDAVAHSYNLVIAKLAMAHLPQDTLLDMAKAAKSHVFAPVFVNVTLRSWGPP